MSDEESKPEPKIPAIFLAPVKAADAREQAAEFMSFLRGIDVVGPDDKVYEIQHPTFFDPDADDRLAALRFEVESWDRHPDVFDDEHRTALAGKVTESLAAKLGAMLPDGVTLDGNVAALAEVAVKTFVDYALEHAKHLVAHGDLMDPPRKNGERVEPYNTQQMKALFGERYEGAVAAGIRPNDLPIYWAQMNSALQRRRETDPKSGHRDSGVVPVPDGDRGGSEVPPPTHQGLASGPDDQPGVPGAHRQPAE